MGFRSLFQEADKDQDGNIELKDFPILIDGYFNSKHIIKIYLGKCINKEKEMQGLYLWYM